ncbi:hypothetical protein [Massilia sp.]|uniref:hypothetical protein n=1 Tax=Massilia sp. TaxID=1882437 RepID=UPI00352F5D7C
MITSAVLEQNLLLIFKMKLNYKILWFDDQPDSAKNMEEGISNRLARLGFSLEVEWNKGVKDEGSFLANLQRRRDIDLILMDWNMGANSDNGAVLAKKLRRKVYTEIVFYSSASPSELRKAIYEQDIDGVYCARRDTLVSETMHVIQTTVKKILDLNHMRGLVMGAVSEFDAQIEEMMSLACSRMKERSKFLNHIRNLIVNSNNSHLRQIEKIDLSGESDPSQLLQHRGFTAFLKYQALCNLLSRKSEDRAVVNILDKLREYETQIIRPRNRLAHARIVELGQRGTMHGRDVEFTDEDLLNLRRDLLAHNDNLCDIRSAIEAGIFDDIILED